MPAFFVMPAFQVRLNWSSMNKDARDAMERLAAPFKKPTVVLLLTRRIRMYCGRGNDEC